MMTFDFYTKKMHGVYSHWRGGWGNGYVKIPKDSPLFGVDYMELNKFVNVHRGLTYGEIEGDFYVVGFDTNHTGDSISYLSEDFVWNETFYLATQLTKLHQQRLAQ